MPNNSYSNLLSMTFTNITLIRYLENCSLFTVIYLPSYMGKNCKSKMMKWSLIKERGVAAYPFHLRMSYWKHNRPNLLILQHKVEGFWTLEIGNTDLQNSPTNLLPEVQETSTRNNRLSFMEITEVIVTYSLF